MKRGPVIRAAALAFVVILIVAMFVGCAKYDGDKAAFCRQLPKAPSFQALLITTSTGTSQDAAEKMRGAARDFRSLEQSAPRSIRAKVAALGDSAERIGRRLADPPSQDNVLTMYGDGQQVAPVPTERPISASRTGVFYNEFSAHPGTASAAIAMLTYAQDDCGIKDLNTTLGLNGYGSPVVDLPGLGGYDPGPTGGYGGSVTIPAPQPSTVPPASTAVTSSTVPAAPAG